MTSRGSANHPYAASADGTATTHGDYMDATVVKAVQLATPLTIVHGWGDTGPALLAKWTEEKQADQRLPPYKIPCDPLNNQEKCQETHTGGQGDFDREKLAASWLAQFTAAGRLNAAVAHAVAQTHHILGLVYADVTIGVVTFDSGSHPPKQSMPVTDSFNRMDVDAGISLSSKTADNPTRNAALQTQAALSAALEGSVAAQNNQPDTASTASRFEWGNTPPGTAGSLDQPYEDPSGAGPRKFLQFNSANASQASTLVLGEGVTSNGNSGLSGGGQPNIGNGEIQVWRGVTAGAIADYANAGFTVVASQETFLGPGQRAGEMQPTGIGSSYYHLPSKQRGGALVATKYDGSGNPVEIAHIVTAITVDGNSNYVGTKGGGGGKQGTAASDYDPADPADVLKVRFVDKSNLRGVDLSNGQVSYTSPARLKVGTGKFPYALSADLEWQPGPQPIPAVTGPSIPTAPQPGWVSNWQNRLALSGSGLEGLGQNDPRGAMNAIAAMLAMQDIYKAAQSPQRDVAGVLAAAWWTHRIEANVATVTLGKSARQFLGTAGTQWVASGGGAYATLTQTGSRTQFENLCSGIGADSPYAMSRGWDSSGLSFTVTNAGGDVEHFGYWLNTYKNDPLDDNACGRADGFRLNSWTFPSGMAVNLTYGPYGGSAILEQLLEVSNSFGRKLDFTWSGSQLTGFNNGLTGGDARSVSLAYVGSPYATSHTDPNGKVTSFTYTPNQAASATQRPLPYGLLDQVFTANSATLAALDYGYDGTNRVISIKDADAIQLGGRNPYSFFVADGARGERDDPLGAQYTVVYDTFGHPTRYIDALGRETDTATDGRGRPLSYTYPELDQEVLTYDERNNPLTLTRKAKPGSGLADIAVSVAYTEAATVAICASPQTCNKPVTQTDARGLVTNIAWDPTTGQLTQIKLPTDPNGLRPETDYGYTSFGSGFRLLTSKTEKIDASRSLVTNFAWNASNAYVPQSTTVDPTGVNLITSFTYDAQGDVSHVDGPRTDVKRWEGIFRQGWPRGE